MFIGIVAYWEGWTPLRPAEQRARAAILGPVVGSPPSPAPLQYGSKATAHVAAPKTVGQIGRPHARPPCGALSAPAPAWHYGRRAARTQITRAAPWPRRGEGARARSAREGSRAPTTRPRRMCALPPRPTAHAAGESVRLSTGGVGATNFLCEQRS